MMRKIVWILGILLVIAGIAWVNRIDMMLQILKIKVYMDQPIGPHKEVTWEKGPLTASESPSRRKPNIIVILADDLVFNDISFYAADKSRATLNTPHFDALGEQGGGLYQRLRVFTHLRSFPGRHHDGALPHPVRV